MAITLKLAAPSTIHAVHWNGLKRDRFRWKSIIQEPFIDRDVSVHQLLKANLFKSTVCESGATATATPTATPTPTATATSKAATTLNGWLWFWIIYARQKINVKIFFPENYFSAAESFDVVIFKRGAFSLTALTSLGRKLPFHLKNDPLKKIPYHRNFIAEGEMHFKSLVTITCQLPKQHKHAT